MELRANDTPIATPVLDSPPKLAEAAAAATVASIVDVSAAATVTPVEAMLLVGVSAMVPSPPSIVALTATEISLNANAPAPETPVAESPPPEDCHRRCHHHRGDILMRSRSDIDRAAEDRRIADRCADGRRFRCPIRRQCGYGRVTRRCRPRSNLRRRTPGWRKQRQRLHRWSNCPSR